MVVCRVWGVVADLNSLNLTKYIEEVVSAICSAKLKVRTSESEIITSNDIRKE